MAALQQDNPSDPQKISIKDILCSEHNLYDHSKAANMKRLTQVGGPKPIGAPE
jgi:hypothetical protein